MAVLVHCMAWHYLSVLGVVCMPVGRVWCRVAV